MKQQRKNSKQKLFDVIDAHADELIRIGDAVWGHPQAGFREEYASHLVQENFGRLGLPYQAPLALTGVRADWRSGRPGPTVAVLGELDSIILPSHPAADPATGAVHACGHNAQVAALLGCAMAFAQGEVADELAGNVVFIAVPAEEFLELDYRKALVAQGKIGLLSGKSEMIRLGVFDDVDLALMVHSAPGRVAHIPESMNGFVVKKCTFRGRAAHAGFAPEEGINALNAATLAVMAIHAQRETFRDADAVRVHEVITRGGDALNVVPDCVRMDVKVRAKTVQAIQSTAAKMDRCLKAGALTVGGGVEIETVAGYLPLAPSRALSDLVLDNARTLLPGAEIGRSPHRGSSTDMGDVSQLMPAIHPYIGGAEGNPHTSEFHFIDKRMAYVQTAKMLAGCVVDLLANAAERAKEIRDTFEPKLTKQQYLDIMAKLAVTETHTFM